MTPSRTTLLALTAAYGIGGIAVAYLPATHRFDQLFSAALSLVTTIAIYVWCRQEAEQRRTLTPGRSALWAAIFPLLFVPVYFLRTRPIKPALWLSLKAYATYAGLCALSALVAMLISLVGLGRAAS